MNERISDKKKRINQEKKKLSKEFDINNSDKKDILKRLIDTASFLFITIQDIEKELFECNDYTVTTINASQTFTKPNPLLKEYRDSVKSYQTIIKQLIDLTKDNPSADGKDELEAFLSK